MITNSLDSTFLHSLTIKSSNLIKNQSQKIAPKDKQANISKVFSSISSCPSKNILEKSKLFMKNRIFSSARNLSKKPLYVQVFKDNIDENFRIKKVFPKL